MEHENSRIRKSATYLLFKITKNFGKNLNTSQVDLILTKCLGTHKKNE